MKTLFGFGTPAAGLCFTLTGERRGRESRGHMHEAVLPPDSCRALASAPPQSPLQKHRCCRTPKVYRCVVAFFYEYCMSLAPSRRHHKDCVTAVCWQPDGRSFFSCSVDKHIFLCDVRGGEVCAWGWQLDAGIYTIAPDHDCLGHWYALPCRVPRCAVAVFMIFSLAANLHACAIQHEPWCFCANSTL